MKWPMRKPLGLVLGLFCVLTHNALGQTPTRTPEPPSTLGLEMGYTEFDTPGFYIRLVKASQTLAALEPKGANGFDFTPADRLAARSKDGFYHLGDIKFRLKMDDRTASRADKSRSLAVVTCRLPGSGYSHMDDR
jgi:hypothetical protein